LIKKITILISKFNLSHFKTRYSERYYPDSVFYDDRHNYEDDESSRYNQRQSHSIRKQPVPQQSFPSSTPLPYQRVSTPSQYNQQNSVYRTPEEVNIPLNQRRPAYGPTTPRYSAEEDDEYNSYEK
jgi:hypothetical protein